MTTTHNTITTKVVGPTPIPSIVVVEEATTTLAYTSISTKLWSSFDYTNDIASVLAYRLTILISNIFSKSDGWLN